MGKSLVKLLRYHREIQYVVLKNIMMIATQQPEYVKSPNKDFATSAIQAIGRCAIGMPEMAGAV
ncbi:5422_t:CDS:2 [Paraglomus brasilianum]|uniref:5422_t:CDS:1 n=1 Tax=Paraglomus brasilianum TaxID=144538 RepID=A0A9N9CQA9_9GLOM|nr:5422_t:CDS:2 [Paraglomus brasilianum]